MANARRPLDGITVVSLEHAIAAPFCTRQLADLGARVIKVERPGVGDFARGYDTACMAWPRTSCGPTAPRKA
jgi:itaconate CoA-transferase